MSKKIVLIGATSGIGREIALIYLGLGFSLGLAGRREERLQELKSQYPGQVEIEPIDVTADDAPERLGHLVQKLGGMDEFLLCSGVGHQNRRLDEAIEMATIATNTAGFTRVLLAAYHYFREKGHGHISVISSIAGTKGLGAAPAYSATKGFQNLYIDALAQLARMEKLDIHFTDIRPGFVRTDLLADGRRYPMLMSAPYAARRIVRAIERRERVAIIDWRYAILIFFWRLIPRFIWERLPISNDKKQKI